MSNKQFSILIPVYNEEKIIENNILTIKNYLEKSRFTDYEILICDNGSSDNTKTICNKLQNEKIIYLRTDTRGIGAGLKIGISHSKYDTLIFISMDLAFDLSFINDSLAIYKEYDIVLGSKAHKESIVIRYFYRNIMSFLYNMLINLIFNLRIKDTQGAMLFKKSSISSFINKLKSDDLFFQTELIVYAKKFGLKITEIPVKVNDLRKSSFDIKKEIFIQFLKLFNLKWQTLKT